MPVTAILNLRAATGGPIPRSFHCLMHPVFLERIAMADPALGDGLHDSGGMPPFSISPLMGIERNRVVENRSYWFRVAMLTDDIEEAFLKALELGLWHIPIHLESHLFMLEDVAVGRHEGLAWSGRESYAQLIQGSEGKEKLTLFLASPMSFKRGDLHCPLPEAALIFGNLARRWNLFTELKLIEKPDCDRVGYASFDLKTERYPLRKGGTAVGAEGRMELIIKDSPEKRRYFETLLRFGFYAGIGIKTNQGMGMCRVT